jgi:hypothetical protein
MTEVIDFFKYNGWGHALHAHTWRKIEDPRKKSWLPWKKNPGAIFVSVMVHSSKWPKEGDLVKFKGENGPCFAEIYGIEWCRDPKDMFIFTLMFNEKTSELTEKSRACSPEKK